jgi:hypothetical protein
MRPAPLPPSRGRLSEIVSDLEKENPQHAGNIAHMFTLTRNYLNHVSRQQQELPSQEPSERQNQASVAHSSDPQRSPQFSSPLSIQQSTAGLNPFTGVTWTDSGSMFETRYAGRSNVWRDHGPSETPLRFRLGGLPPIESSSYSPQFELSDLRGRLYSHFRSRRPLTPRSEESDVKSRETHIPIAPRPSDDLPISSLQKHRKYFSILLKVLLMTRGHGGRQPNRIDDKCKECVHARVRVC